MTQHRIWEIDALRGICILLMIGYHALFDLFYFFGIGINLFTPVWSYAVYFVAGIFIFLSGISANLSRNPARRGVLVLAAALIISTATRFLFPGEVIAFGILHLLGVCMLLSYPVLKSSLLQKRFLVLGVCVSSIIIGIIFAGQSAPGYYLLPLGLVPENYTAMDYFPLLPWFGVFLAGMYCGRIWYHEKKTRLPNLRPPKFLTLCGKYTLYIYLLHQPVLYGVFYLIFTHTNRYI